MRVKVDRARCQGHARCAALCPEVFTLDDLGFSTVGEEEVPARLESSAQRAADNCPEGAISVMSSATSHPA